MKQGVLVTGSNGFVGRAVVRHLSDAGYDLRMPGRDDLGGIDGHTDWQAHLDGVEFVVHLAARAHVMKDHAADPAALYREINLDGTRNLAKQAAAAGVRRFVFMSTIKAGLEPTWEDDPYGASKHEAETFLTGHPNGMEAVILRPPLVYGPGVKGNFLSLLELVARGTPLPLGLVSNQRSLIYVGNLASAVEAAFSAAPGIYSPCDRQDVSTPELVRAIAAALDCPARLLPVPVWLLRLGGTLTGRAGAIDRLVGSLCVPGALDGWVPPHDMAEGLRDTAQWFRSREGGQ